MTLTSKARKEEAELRKIAKQARLIRKEAAARELRLKLKRGRQVQKEGTDGESGLSGAHVGGSSMRRRGAVVLPEEVLELRQRLFGEEGASGAAAGVEGTVVEGISVSAHSPPSSSACGQLMRAEEPRHSVEVHHKRKQFLVSVVLHHVPPQHIDVSETTATALIVDTCKHTKKYRLVVPVPVGMCVDPSRAEYEFNCGVLNCTLPIVGDIPASLQRERDAMLTVMQKQKCLRFRMGEDGELKVRSRRALLGRGEMQGKGQDNKGRENGEAGAFQNGKYNEGEGQQREEGSGDSHTDEVAEAQERQAAHKQRKKRARKETTVTETASTQGTGKVRGELSELQPVEKKFNNQKRERPTSADVFKDERRRALELAKAAGKAAQMTLRERIAQSKATQERMSQRMVNRQNRRETQFEKTRDSFARVLEEQKRQLVAQAEKVAVAVAVTAAGKAGGRGEEEGRGRSSGKRVTFAESQEQGEK